MQTSGAFGEPLTAVTTVVLAQGSSNPNAIISYQAFEDSAAANCAPSYSLLAAADPVRVNRFISVQSPAIAGFLRYGISTIIPVRDAALMGPS